MNDAKKAKELCSAYECIGLTCEQCRYSVAMNMASWKNKQYEEEKKELLGLVKLIKVDETNQSVIEDLIAMLELE